MSEKTLDQTGTDRKPWAAEGHETRRAWHFFSLWSKAAESLEASAGRLLGTLDASRRFLSPAEARAWLHEAYRLARRGRAASERAYMAMCRARDSRATEGVDR